MAVSVYLVACALLLGLLQPAEGALPAHLRSLQRDASGAAPPCTRESFKLFQSEFQRSYLSDAEENFRFDVFCQSWKEAVAVQDRNPHAQIGVTQFSDKTSAEFHRMVNGGGSSVRDGLLSLSRAENFTLSATERAEHLPLIEAGAAFDWRDRGVVTPIKQQGNCGSCWAFSATANVETVYAIATGTLNNLSEEELVACVPGQYCLGGSIDKAWLWLIDTQGGGMTTYAAYPYISGGGYVPYCPTGDYPIAARISTYGNLPSHNEPHMAAWVASRGPLSIGVDCDSWKYYNGGVLTNCAASQMNHAVMIVGFDTSHSPPFWTIKNSWGTSWGESGYIRVHYNINACMVGVSPCTSAV